MSELRRNDRAAAERVLCEVREQFIHWLGQDYAAVGFERDASGGGSYLLEPYEG